MHPKYGLRNTGRNVPESNEFPTPEDINDDRETAPSKRVLSAYPPYRKVLEGTLAARAVGINSMREACPHFRDWVESLEALA